MNETQSLKPLQPSPGSPTRYRWAELAARPGFVCGLLAIVTLAVFWPLKNCDFVNYDDPQYVTLNSHVRQGLGVSGLSWSFRTGHAANWHPLTWLSHMLDVELFGLNPAGHHLVNVLLHTANALLLFLVLRQFTGAHWRSALVAALFALHPLHVESVAWISERKDVLSTLFWLLTLWAYGRYAREQSRLEHQASLGMGAKPAFVPKRWTRNYWLALLFFVLGLLAKPMLVTLPFVLLLLDYWPLERWRRFPRTAEPLTPNSAPSITWRLVKEKIPFSIVSGIFCVITFLIQKNSGAVVALTKIPIALRLENIGISYTRYLGKLFWPAGLALPYPYPAEWSAARVIFAATLTVSLCIAAWRLGRRWPFLRTGWFWFFGTLIPVIGLIQVGNQSLADRYTYVPSIGIFIVLAWGASAALNRWKIPMWTGSVVALLAVSVCAVRTRDQLRYWKNSETLFRHTLALTTNNNVVCNLGSYLFDQGRVEEAMENYRRALQLNAKDPLALDGLGCCFFNQGRTDEAIRSFQQSLQASPNRANTLFNLGSALAQQGQYLDAIGYFKAALRLEPDNPDISISLGNVFLRQNNPAEAINCYQAALRAAPDNVNAHKCLAAVLTQLGRGDEALSHGEAALRLAPNDAEAHCAMGAILARRGQRKEAIVQLKEALRLQPDYEAAKRELQALSESAH